MNKKTLYKIILLIAILLLQIFIPTKAVQAKAKLVKFEDKDLAQAVYDSIKNNWNVEWWNDKWVWIWGIDKIETLDLESKDISDLTGLEEFENLKNLNLKNNHVSTTSKLSGLTNLTQLNLANNELKKIELGDKPNLTELDVSANEITNISGLSNCPNLKYLNLNSNNNLTDISILSGLKYLISLDISYCNITDIRPLANNTTLQYLVMRKNKIKDISSINKLTKLITLNVAENDKIEDISAISNMTKLQNLILSDNAIKDISPIPNNAPLRVLYLGNNKIEDMSKVENFNSLGQFYSFSGQKIERKIGSGEIELPPIFKQALDSNSKIYMGDGYYPTPTNCLYSIDGDYISAKLNEDAQKGDIYIYSGPAVNTRLLLTRADDLVEIQFKDQNMYYAVKEFLGNKVIDFDNRNLIISMTTSDKDSVTGLTLTNRDIKDISGIENFTNLTDYLNLADNHLDNNAISYIAQLPNLKLLSISGNSQITDISGLSGLTALKALNIQKCNVEDISVLSNMVSLQSLYAKENHIKDASVLEGLPVLTTVELLGQTIEAYQDEALFDLCPIFIQARTEGSKIYTAEEITLNNCEYANEEDKTKVKLSWDVESGTVTLNGGNAAGTVLTLKKPVEVKEITFTDENLYSAVVDALGDLILENNPETRTIIVAQSSIDNLDSLNISGKGISDLTGISQFTALTELIAYDNKISDVKELKDLGLKILSLNENDLESIEDLLEITTLEKLYLSDNDLSSLEGISALENLKELDVSKNQITDVAEVNIMEGITVFICTDQFIETTAENAEVKLLPIFNQAKEENSKIYTEDDFEYENCSLVVDDEGLKVLVDKTAAIAEVRILGGNAGGTVLFIQRELETKDIKFVDEKLYEAMVEAIGDIIIEENPDNSTITVLPEDIEEIEELDLKDKEISDLTGLENFTSIIALSLNNNNIHDLSKLASMQNLKNLYVYNNPIDNLDVISSLPVIEELGASNNTNKETNENFELDLSPLKEKESLKRLYIGSDGITDENLESLRGLGLVQLDISFNNITNLNNESPISALENIKSFIACGNKISDISGLGNLANLESIDLSKNQISDVRVISQIKERGLLTNINLKNQEIEISTINERVFLPQIFDAVQDTNDKYMVFSERGFAYENCQGLPNIGTGPEITKVVLDENATTATVTINGGNADGTVLRITYKTLTDITYEGDIRTDYVEGEEFDPSGLIIYAEYDNGDREEISDYTIEPDRPLEIGDDKVVIKYEENGEEKEIEIPITVSEKVLTGLEITKDPTKTEYVEGESFDRVGMEVTAIFNNGMLQEVVEDYEINPSGPLSLNDRIITVLYTYKGVTKAAVLDVGTRIIISEKVLTGLEITKDPTKVEYVEGENFDKAGMEVTAIYNDGKVREVVENYEINPSGALSLTDTVVTVSYTEKGVTKEATLDVGIKIIIKPRSDEEIEIDVGDLEIEQDGLIAYITKIQPKTSITELLEKITTNGDIEIYDKNNNKVTDYTQYATSKMKLIITKGENTKEFILVVRGDVNGDGDSNFNDMLQMNKHRLQKKLLEGAYLKAGEVDGQEGVTFRDMLKINKYRLNKINIL